MAGIQTECYACGSKEIESYDRVTGYMQKISGWNASKQREQQDRYRYEV
jgi:ribonucleoside-triphosphate reductase